MQHGARDRDSNQKAQKHITISQVDGLLVLSVRTTHLTMDDVGAGGVDMLRSIRDDVAGLCVSEAKGWRCASSIGKESSCEHGVQVCPCCGDGNFKQHTLTLIGNVNVGVAVQAVHRRWSWRKGRAGSIDSPGFILAAIIKRRLLTELQTRSVIGRIPQTS